MFSLALWRVQPHPELLPKMHGFHWSESTHRGMPEILSPHICQEGGCENRIKE